MATFRFQALSDVLARKPKEVIAPSDKISNYFAENVFDKSTMREYLTDDTYKSVLHAMEHGSRIDRKIADYVAASMKEWAMSKGATHYTHWFQPLTGATAEKHDSFFDPSSGTNGIEKFAGSMLVQQESDASSFPNGGIRNTFEARGYTAWDPSSPAFVIEKTLCIPTIFIAYTGEALDYKMPLLKALNAIEKEALDVCRYFDKNVSKVTTTLGWEQEYFLVDKAFFNGRQDLMITGRALFGHNPAKGQQLDDHYFGSISDRVLAFMRDFETEALRLGIPVTTRHNEVAPNQFECAPMFEETNLAVDHNALLMDLLEKIARRHDFRILLHEKPFAGLNGSGKHNNWSLATNTGINLLSPGKNPKSNLQFLTFFVNTIKGIHEYSDVLRASIASASNDHRLGANEAPPAIISTFIGEQLTQTLNELEQSIMAGKMTPEDKTEMKLSIGKIPQILLDNTDRNRTSPFAFTGNKFEFRAVGSTANCASAMIALNTIVAKQLKEFRKLVDAKINDGEKKDIAILKVLQQYIKESKTIRFEGNGYGDDWVKEAESRGLSNLRDTPRALKVMTEKKNQELFTELNVFSEREINARFEIDLENYIMKLQIETRVINDMARNTIIPTAIKYQNQLIQNIQGLLAIFGENAEEIIAPKEMLSKISGRILGIQTLLVKLNKESDKANEIDSAYEKAVYFCDNVKVLFDEIREHADQLEVNIDDSLWPLPKLREILFTR